MENLITVTLECDAHTIGAVENLQKLDEIISLAEKAGYTSRCVSDCTNYDHCEHGEEAPPLRDALYRIRSDEIAYILDHTKVIEYKKK